MKYHVKRMTPEFRAIAYSLLIFQLSILFGLYWSYLSITQFFFGYSILLLISIITSHYQTEIVDKSNPLYEKVS